MKVLITNDTAAPMLCGGKLIQPGDSREVDIDTLPPGDPARPADDEPHAPAGGGTPSADQQQANLDDLLMHKVDDVKASLPDFSDETLAQIRAMEEAGQARKGVLSAIAEMQLQRASDKAGAPT